MRHFVHLDKLRVCYSPSQIWNFILNPISTVELQHFEARVQDDGQKAKFSLSHQYLSGPMSQPRKKIIIWQVLPQGVFTFCCSVLKTTTRYISASIQQTLPKPQAHALIQSKDGRFQSGTVLWFFLWQPCRHREKSRGDGHRETHVHKHCESGHGEGELSGCMLIRTGSWIKWKKMICH